MSFVAVDWWSSVETTGDVGVAEPADGVFTGHRCSEQSKVGGVEGTEAGHVASLLGCRPAQGVKRGDAFAFQGGGGQGIEVTVVGRDADLIVAPQVAHTFSHWA